MSGEEAHGAEIAVLKRRADDADRRFDRLDQTLGDHRKEIDALKRFQSWVFGVGSGVGALVGFAVQGIRDRIGLGG